MLFAPFRPLASSRSSSFFAAADANGPVPFPALPSVSLTASPVPTLDIFAMPLFSSSSRASIVAQRMRSESMPSASLFDYPATFSTLPRKRSPISRIGHRISRIFSSSPGEPTIAGTPYTSAGANFSPVPSANTPNNFGETDGFASPPLNRRLSVSLNSLTSAAEPRMVSSTSVQELRRLAATLESESEENPSMLAVYPGRQHRPSLSSSTASRATANPSIFEAATSPSEPSTARSSWEDDQDRTIKIESIDTPIAFRAGPRPFSPTVVEGTEGLAPSFSLSAIPAFPAYTLEVKGLEFLAETWEQGQESELRRSLDARLRELMSE